jgi:WD40 repeat protein
MDYSSEKGEKSQRTCLEKLLYDLDILSNKFSNKISKFSLLQYNHFNEIKNEIDIKRETLLMHANNMLAKTYNTNSDDEELGQKLMDNIHKTSAEMIEKIECAENNFKNNLNRLIPNLESFNTDKMFLEKLLGQTNENSSSSSHENVIKDFTFKIKDAKKKLENFILLEYDLSKYKFHSSGEFDKIMELSSVEFLRHPFDWNSFGRLELAKDLVKSLSEEILNVFACSLNLNELELWNLNTGALVKSLHGHTSGITCFVFYENNILTASCDHTIKIWDFKSNLCSKTLRGHTDRVWKIVILNRDDRTVSLLKNF